jgi:hypothetical protein
MKVNIALVLLGAASAMLVTPNQQFSEFTNGTAKEWFVNFGEGFVDGVTFNFTEGQNAT